LLVDKQDFYCPISYTFASGKRMWYQRKPDNFVGQKKDIEGNYDLQAGWEGISIPFEAELVTTDVKGEITHFYSGSEESKNDKGTKIGHEYWLREFNGTVTLKEGSIYNAPFDNPTATGPADKTVDNTFLWDYYYSKDSRRDDNEDIYQNYYQKKDIDGVSHVNVFEDYAYLTQGKPYIIGFPGERYYEFDLSGTFKARHTFRDIPQLGAQTITFASQPAITIATSYEENRSKTVNHGDYSFTPNYLSIEQPAGIFPLNGDGSSFNKTDEATTPVPFRPYFTSSAGSRQAKTIEFYNALSDLGGEDEHQTALCEDLIVRAGRNCIIVTSALLSNTDVLIYSAAGALVNRFTLEPGQTVETPIHNRGVYIVRTADGRIAGRKLAVRQ